MVNINKSLVSFDEQRHLGYGRGFGFGYGMGYGYGDGDGSGFGQGTTHDLKEVTRC